VETAVESQLSMVGNEGEIGQTRQSCGHEDANENAAGRQPKRLSFTRCRVVL
jgi:hypothetical protein